MRTAFIAAALALLLFVSCDPLVRASTSERVSLHYVGAIAVGQPFARDGRTHIPLGFTGGQWFENSGRVLEEVVAERRGQEIHFWINTCVATSGAAVAPEIVLELQAGRYQLVYDDPDHTSTAVGIAVVE
jgi:hypothetical protein